MGSCFLFDLDGTLVDSLEDLRGAVNHALERFGHPPLDSDTVRSCVGDGVRVLLARSFLGLEATALPAEGSGSDAAAIELREATRRQAIRELLERAAKLEDPGLDDAIAAFGRHYREHLLDWTLPYPGVEETLEALTSRGARLAVVSNKPEEFTERIVVELGLSRYFDLLVGGDTAGATKPDAAPVLHALDRLGAAPARSLMVGDSPNDILCGQRAGCRTAAVTYGFRPAEELRAYAPDRLIDDPRGLLE